MGPDPAGRPGTGGGRPRLRRAHLGHGRAGRSTGAARRDRADRRRRAPGSDRRRDVHRNRRRRMAAGGDDHDRQQDAGRAAVAGVPAFPTRSEIWLKLLERREADLAAVRSAEPARPARPGGESWRPPGTDCAIIQIGTAPAWSSSVTRARRPPRAAARSAYRPGPEGSRARDVRRRTFWGVEAAIRRIPECCRTPSATPAEHPQPAIPSGLRPSHRPRRSRRGRVRPGPGRLRTPNWMIGARPLAPEEQQPSALNRRSVTNGGSGALPLR